MLPSAKIAALQSLLSTILCNISVFKKCLVSYDIVLGTFGRQVLIINRGLYFLLNDGVIGYLDGMCFVVSAQFTLHQTQSSSNYTLSELGALRTDIQGLFSVE